MIGQDGRYRSKISKPGGIESGESGAVEYPSGQLTGRVVYGKTEEEEEEEDGVVGNMIGEDQDVKSALTCEGLFQSGRGGVASSGNKTEGKYSADYSRNRYQTLYRGDEYRGDYKQHRSQANPSPCYPGEPSCGSGMTGPALRKAPLAPTLHPHPQNQTQQQQQPHLPLSSLLDDTEDDVTSSVNSAISAIAAAAAASCMPGEHNNAGSRGEERRDIIGGLLGGLGLGPLGVSPGAPSSTSGMDKAYRGTQDSMGSTMTPSTHHNQQQHQQQASTVKPKRPRKPRPKKEAGSGAGATGDSSKRRTHSQRGTNGDPERLFLCSVCGRGFTRRETLRRHDRIHTGEKPHHCSVCGKNFREAFHLTKHHTVHSGEKNYKCGLCGKDFGYAQSLKRHGKLHQKGEFEEIPTTAGGSNSNSGNSAVTPGGSISQERDQGNSESYYAYPQGIKPQGPNTQPPPRLYTCAICWKSFRHHFHLTAHHQAVHEGGDRLFCCEVCGKAFAYANSLTRHRLSQHGLTRTGQANQPGGGGVPGGSGSATGSVSESEAATNALLQLVPPSGTHGGQQTHTSVPHSQQPPQQPPTGFSPLFYLPELAPPHSATSSAPTYSHPLPHNSTLTTLSNHQQPVGIKGEPMYPTGPVHPLNTTPSLHPLLLLSPSQQQHNQHAQQLPVEMQIPQPQQQNLQPQDDLKKHRKKKKGKETLHIIGTTGGQSAGGGSEERDEKQKSEKQKEKRRKLLKKKRGGIHQQELRRKKRLAHFLKLRRAGGGLNMGNLSSLDVPQKCFPCPLCPRTIFSRQSALLVHRAVRHPPKTSCPQARLECPVCGKRSRKFLAALSHRGFHLTKGSFSCPRCPLRFWNGVLLGRHTVACRGAVGGGRGGSMALKLKSAPSKVVKKEGQGETVLMEYRH